MTTLLTIVIKFISLFIATVVWAVVGLLAWVPILLRGVAVYASAITASAFFKTDVVAAENLLHKSISFYLDGFTKIFAALSQSGSAQESGTLDSFFSGLLRLLLLQVPLITLFWISAILLCCRISGKDWKQVFLSESQRVSYESFIKKITVH